MFLFAFKCIILIKITLLTYLLTYLIGLVCQGSPRASINSDDPHSTVAVSGISPAAAETQRQHVTTPPTQRVAYHCRRDVSFTQGQLHYAELYARSFARSTGARQHRRGCAAAQVTSGGNSTTVDKRCCGVIRRTQTCHLLTASGIDSFCAVSQIHSVCYDEMRRRLLRKYADGIFFVKSIIEDSGFNVLIVDA